VSLVPDLSGGAMSARYSAGDSGNSGIPPGKMAALNVRPLRSMTTYAAMDLICVLTLHDDPSISC
jgi:hypothetical protein